LAQGGDGLLEGQAVVPEHLGGRGAALADDGCKDQGAADGAALAFLRCCGSRLKNVNKITAKRRLAAALTLHPVVEATEIVGHFGDEVGHLDIARLENNGCISVVGQRQKQVFDRYLAVGLLVGVGGGTLKRAAQVVRQFQPVQNVGLVRRGHVGLFPSDASGPLGRAHLSSRARCATHRTQLTRDGAADDIIVSLGPRPGSRAARPRLTSHRHITVRAFATRDKYCNRNCRLDMAIPPMLPAKSYRY
jgi:hypothetical protein